MIAIDFNDVYKINTILGRAQRILLDRSLYFFLRIVIHIRALDFLLDFLSELNIGSSIKDSGERA